MLKELSTRVRLARIEKELFAKGIYFVARPDMCRC